MSDPTQGKQEAAGAPDDKKDDKKKEVPVHSNTPENSKGRLNPSAPEGSNTTPEPPEADQQIS